MAEDRLQWSPEEMLHLHHSHIPSIFHEPPRNEFRAHQDILSANVMRAFLVAFPPSPSRARMNDWGLIFETRDAGHAFALTAEISVRQADPSAHTVVVINEDTRIKYLDKLDRSQNQMQGADHWWMMKGIREGTTIEVILQRLLQAGLTRYVLDAEGQGLRWWMDAVLCELKDILFTGPDWRGEYDGLRISLCRTWHKSLPAPDVVPLKRGWWLSMDWPYEIA